MIRRDLILTCKLLLMSWTQNYCLIAFPEVGIATFYYIKLRINIWHTVFKQCTQLNRLQLVGILGFKRLVEEYLHLSYRKYLKNFLSWRTNWKRKPQSTRIEPWGTLMRHIYQHWKFSSRYNKGNLLQDWSWLPPTIGAPESKHCFAVLKSTFSAH